MRRFAILVGIAGVVVVSGLALPAWAVPTTFTYTGVVTQKSIGLSTFSAPWNNPGIVVGSPVTFTYTFESSTPDTDGGPNTGQYLSITQIVLTMGPATSTMNFTSPPPLPRIYNGNDIVFPSFTTDRYGVLAFSLPGNVDQLTFQMDDTTFSTFNSDALPLTQPDPADFNFFFGLMEAQGSFSTSQYRFVFDPLPEPGTMGLIAMSGAVALLRRGRRARMGLSE
jgi:hypothetical protein